MWLISWLMTPSSSWRFMIWRSPLVAVMAAWFGLTPVAKTSGSKGMQLYCAITTSSAEHPSGYAKALAERLSRAEPDLIVAKMAKNLRPHKVFIDWSQNNQYKTTVAPYSLRARDLPTVSTPITWAEVDDVLRRAYVSHASFLHETATPGSLDGASRAALRAFLDLL